MLPIIVGIDNGRTIQRLFTIWASVIRVNGKNDSLNEKEQDESQKTARPHAEKKLAKDATPPSFCQPLYFSAMKCQEGRLIDARYATIQDFPQEQFLKKRQTAE